MKAGWRNGRKVPALKFPAFVYREPVGRISHWAKSEW